MRARMAWVGLLLTVVACGQESGVGTPQAGTPSPAQPSDVMLIVDGPVIAAEAATGQGRDAIVAGPLAYDNGCLLLAGMPVIWPVGTSWNQQRKQVVFADGSVARPGSRLHGGGGYLDGAGGGLNELMADLQPDAAGLIRQCLGETREVAGFNSGDPVNTR